MWELDHKEGWAPKNCCFQTVVLEKTLESPLDCKEIKPVNPKGNQPSNLHWKYWCWSWSSNPLATWCEELTHWKRPWCWERLRARKEGVHRRWDAWMASSTQWTWVWANSGGQWRTEKPGALQSTGVAKGRTQLSDWTAITTTRWVGHINQLEAWRKRKTDLFRRIGTLPAHCLHIWAAALTLPWVDHTHILLILFLWKTLPHTQLQWVPWDLIVCREVASSVYMYPAPFSLMHNWQRQGGSWGLDHRGPCPSIHKCAATPLGKWDKGIRGRIRPTLLRKSKPFSTKAQVLCYVKVYATHG